MVDGACQREKTRWRNVLNEFVFGKRFDPFRLKLILRLQCGKMKKTVFTFSHPLVKLSLYGIEMVSEIATNSRKCPMKNFYHFFARWTDTFFGLQLVSHKCAFSTKIWKFKHHKSNHKLWLKINNHNKVVFFSCHPSMTWKKSNLIFRKIVFKIAQRTFGRTKMWN